MTDTKTTLNDALVTIIQKTQGAVETGVSFLSDQIPDVVQQLLMWKVVENIVIFILSLLILLAYYKGVKAAIAYDKKGTWNGATFPTALFGGIPALLSLGAGISCLLTVLKIYIAPKVWLIEYAASLAK